ncbi:MAG: hypothetical protein NT030_08355 [Candidatus Saganbacteria bacterium]|nr:hypothetical protein [Candidatus Saganbacteria bacterium]
MANIAPLTFINNNASQISKSKALEQFSSLLGNTTIKGLNGFARAFGLDEDALNNIIYKKGLGDKLIAIEGEDGIELKRADQRIQFLGEADLSLKAELQLWLEELDKGLGGMKDPLKKEENIKKWIGSAKGYFYMKFQYRFGIIGFSKKGDQISVLILYKKKSSETVEPKINAKKRDSDGINTIRTEYDAKKIVDFLKSIPYDSRLDRVLNDLNSLLNEEVLDNGEAEEKYMDYLKNSMFKE